MSIAKHEHWLLYTFWNAKAKRPEIATATLYDAVIDKHELTPWSSTPATKALLAGTTVSSVTRETPVVAHRTFALPATVTDIAVTRTLSGVTPIQVLLTLAGGNVLALDRRLVDPRRPQGEPTEAEKAEGLLQYSPVLPLRHSWYLSLDKALARPVILQSHPSDFESTTLVAALGVDHLFVRTAPAKTFDQLEPDFNLPVLLATIALATVFTFVFKQLVANKEMKEAFA